MITGKLYDYLKWLAQVLLPAFGALYVALAALWHFPAPQEVAGTVLAVDAFLGVILGISQVAYANATTGGTLNVLETDTSIGYDLELDGHPEELKDKKEVRFKVKHQTAAPKRAKKRARRSGTDEVESSGPQG